MQFRSIRSASLLAALVVTSGLWAYSANFTADPTDPLYPATANSNGCQRPQGGTQPSPTCFDPPGQWNMFSYVPTAAATANNHPSGISADLAWRITTGRPDVEAVVFDSGVNYDHVDLRNQIWLNCKELPAPQNAAGLTVAGSSPGCREPGAAYDIASGINGAPDGIFSIRDYQNDVRVTASTILPDVLSRSDLRTFEDGIDNDGNGFKDDISGFDFDDVDGDEYDHRDFGHGTGRNGVIAAEANNAAGIAGMCTNCRITNARIEDTYVVVRSETTANAAIWAADLGFEVINMSLGHVGASSMSRKAFEYAYSRNVLAISAIANEFHFHHGYVGLYDEVFAVGALSYAGSTTAGIAPRNGPPNQAPTTYLRKANYSNYGAHLNVVAPSDNLTTSHFVDAVPPPLGDGKNDNNGFGDSGGTSSATPHVVGTAALVFSIFRNCRDGLAPVGSACNYVVTDQFLKDISAQEVRQVINQTADDIKASDDPASGTYPVSVGWDKWTGYGRIDAEAAVNLVKDGKIPPEADINSPDWYTYVDGTVPVKFYANNRWRGNYSWVLEVAPGVEPTGFTLIEAGSGAADKSKASTSLINNFTSNWDTTGLSPGGYTLRLRVTDAVDSTIKGEDRMFVWLRRGLLDVANHTGFPIRVTRTFNGEVIPVSTESMSNALVDLDSDNKLEIIVATADGEVRVYKQDGTPFSSFGANGVVMTDPLPGLPIDISKAFDNDFSNGEVPVTGASIIGGVAVGDIDRDGAQEICAGAVNGKLYCWKTNGSLQPGFPVNTDLPKRYDQYAGLTTNDLLQGEALVPPPSLGNIDGDASGTLEIAAVSRDQKLYIWKADGTRLSGFPVTLGTVKAKDPAGSISGVLIADIDNDGQQDIVVGTNEVSGSAPNTAGRIYAFSRTGAAKTGWPVQPFSASADGVPIVAQGVVNGPLAANFDTDAQLEIVSSAFLGDIIIYNHDGVLSRTLSGTHAENGPGSDLNEETQEGGPGRQADAPVHSYVGLGAIAALNPQAGLEYVAGTVGNNLVANVAAGSGAVTNFFHYLSAWDATTGRHLGGWPRIMEGWQFINGPVVADLDGNNTPEVIEASSGLFVHAFNGASGGVIPGWPKFTGHWSVNTPSVGDLDNDGKVEVVNSTRLGYIHAWSSTGTACNGAAANAQWRKYRHDEWNTGAFGTDTLRPATVSDLGGTRTGAAVNLTWTAVGDDGACGPAANYELVASSSPITTTAAFDDPNLTRRNLTATAPGQPMSASQSETAARYYTLRVADEMGNRSPLSASVLVAAAPTVTGTGAVAITQTGSPAGDPGTTVTAGSFTLAHTAPANEAHQVSQITLLLSDATVFGSITLTGPDGRTATVTAPSSSAAFNFDPALQIAPGATASFTVTAQLAASATAAISPSWLNSAYAGADPAVSAATAGYALLLLLSAMWFLPRRLAVATLLAIGMLAGCSSDRGGTTPAVTQTRTSTVVINTIGAATTSGGTVTYTGLPATLGTVTLRY